MGDRGIKAMCGTCGTTQTLYTEGYKYDDAVELASVMDGSNPLFINIRNDRSDCLPGNLGRCAHCASEGRNGVFTCKPFGFPEQVGEPEAAVQRDDFTIQAGKLGRQPQVAPTRPAPKRAWPNKRMLTLTERSGGDARRQVNIDPSEVVHVGRAVLGGSDMTGVTLRSASGGWDKRLNVEGKIVDVYLQLVQALGDVPPQAMGLIYKLRDKRDALEMEIREWRVYAWLDHGRDSEDYHSLDGGLPLDESGGIDLDKCSLKCSCGVDFSKVSPRQALNPGVARQVPEVVEVMPSPDEMRAEPITRTTENSEGTAGVIAGYEDAPAPGPVRADGQYASYWVLKPEERAKGFVRPVRRSYKHVGMPGPKTALRDLTPEEAERYSSKYGYVKFEPNPDYPATSSITGRFWTQSQLDAVGKGCGTVTTMGAAIAETYARSPQYYGSTFCVHCGKHFPVGAIGEFVWWGPEQNGQTDERVGT